MAKLKKTARKSAGGARGTPAQAERFGKSITESAQQIWLAGMGAFNRAQAEGGKLFDSLVRDGLSLEQTARKLAGARAEVVRDAVEDTVGQARERAADTWDKLEKVFEDRVQQALVKLGVPGRDDINALSARVERLTKAVRDANGGRAPAASGNRAPRKPAAKAAPSKPTSSKGAAAKSAPNTASRKRAAASPVASGVAPATSPARTAARKPAARVAKAKPAATPGG
jgi:poly(hydroxyalkanoate) granule-associated protein